MSDPTVAADIAAMSFEDALAELEQIERDHGSFHTDRSKD